MLTDTFIATAPAGFGGTGFVGVPAGAYVTPTAGMRPWASRPGTALPCVIRLTRPVAVAVCVPPAVVLPAVVPLGAPVTAQNGTARNDVQLHAGSQLTGTQIGTTLGTHSPGRPQS
jgi:hypothetical protein